MKTEAGSPKPVIPARGPPTANLLNALLSALMCKAPVASTGLLTQLSWATPTSVFFKSAILRTVTIARRAKALGYESYHLPGVLTVDGRPNGGLVTLVRKSVPHRPGDTLNSGAAQLQLAWLNGRAVINLYSPPDKDEDLMQGFLHLHVRNQLQNKEYMFAGDSNSEVDNSPFFDFVQAAACTPCTDRTPTRWTGSRCIDWFGATPRFGLLWKGKMDTAVSDHVPIVATITGMDQPLQYQEGRLKPSPAWVKPDSVDTDAWRQALRDTWLQEVAETQEYRQLENSLRREIDGVQLEWDLYMRLPETCFRKAVKRLQRTRLRTEALQACAQLEQQAHYKNHKGHPGVHQMINLQTRSAGSCNRHESERRIGKQLARLYEARKLLLKPDSPAARLQLHRLLQKLWGSGGPAGFRQQWLKCTSEIIQCQAEQTRLAEERTASALSNWQADMRAGNLRKLSRWLKGREQDEKAVAITRNNVVALTRQQALDLIRAHWLELWGEQAAVDLTPENIGQTLLQGFPQRNKVAVQWQNLTTQDLLGAFRECKGAGGPDSWSSEEVKRLPEHAIGLMLRLSHSIGSTPVDCLTSSLKQPW